MSEKDLKGVTVKKEEDLSEWYTQILQKAEMIEYSPVSGCYIMRPNSYSIWEKVQQYFDVLIKKIGVRNSYFPLFIPESLLSKESSHIKGFAPEVAWVEHGGDTKLKERLAIRPTSETIMYDSYSKWIRSYHDLPLKLNQWCNVVRWEFKHPMPFIRGREFLWQEGHTAFSSSEEAQKETYQILDFYEELFRELYALPVLKGKKSENEKFAGAEYTLSVEAIMPNGKSAQGATSHHLGQNFAKAFDISFLDEKGERKNVWQNSWGISTRSLGLMILVHGDNKGLILPPRVASLQVALVPIIFEQSKAQVLAEAKRLEMKLAEKFSVYLDDRKDYSAGWKFNEWEMKGVPLRLELGPKDLEKKQVMAVRRDTGEKQALPLAGIEKEVQILLEQIQTNLYQKAQKALEESIVTIEDYSEARELLEKKKIIFASWCGRPQCEEKFKTESGGAKSLNSPLQQPKLEKGQKCFFCEHPAQAWFYFGKSY